MLIGPSLQREAGDRGTAWFDCTGIEGCHLLDAPARRGAARTERSSGRAYGYRLKGFAERCQYDRGGVLCQPVSSNIRSVRLLLLFLSTTIR